jgi:hypothetical protein
MASSVEVGGAVGRPEGAAPAVAGGAAAAANAPGTSDAPRTRIDVTIILARRILLRNALTSRRLFRLDAARRQAAAAFLY